jgi:RimJ/RimL family protein N-acetyltransferase
MEIRKTEKSDIKRMMEIYEYAKEYMQENGNKNQWTEGYPQQKLIEDDIKKGNSYICIDENEIIGTFYFGQEIELTYKLISNGKWMNDETYGVIHRIAVSRNKKGIATYCINWCFELCGNIRIDTHRENIPMQKTLEKLGFKYCGVIHLNNGDERIAFQKIKTN